MNLIVDEDKEVLRPIGLGRNPTIIFTPDQIRHIPLKVNTKVTVGCISGILVSVGFECHPINNVYCKVRLSENCNERWVPLGDLLLY
jgi:hypothetical protein